MTTYYTVAPPPHLAGIVRYFWVLEGTVSAGDSYIHRAMADGCAEMLFHYRGTFDEITEAGRIPSFSSGYHSQSSKYRRFVTEEDFGIFGAYLYPFAARWLVGLPADELTNQMPDMPALFGESGRELEEHMMLAADNSSRILILTTFFTHRLRQATMDCHPAVAVVRHVIHSGNRHTVRELAHNFNLSERQFGRKFKEYSGFSPKLYLRIVRFGDVCNRYGKIVPKNLTATALECGYYDQSHFIRDFKAFSGYLPGTYFSGHAEGVEWREG